MSKSIFPRETPGQGQAREDLAVQGIQRVAPGSVERSQRAVWNNGRRAGRSKHSAFQVRLQTPHKLQNSSNRKRGGGMLLNFSSARLVSRSSVVIAMISLHVFPHPTRPFHFFYMATRVNPDPKPCSSMNMIPATPSLLLPMALPWRPLKTNIPQPRPQLCGMETISRGKCRQLYHSPSCSLSSFSLLRPI